MLQGILSLLATQACSQRTMQLRVWGKHHICSHASALSGT